MRPRVVDMNTCIIGRFACGAAAPRMKWTISHPTYLPDLGVASHFLLGFCDTSQPLHTTDQCPIRLSRLRFVMSQPPCRVRRLPVNGGSPAASRFEISIWP